MTPLTPPVEIAAWLACLTFCVMLFNHISKAWFTLRGKPTPAESAAAAASLSERIAKVENCIGSCKREQDARLDALEASQAALRELVSTEIDKVFRRVNSVADLTAQSKGELDIIKSQLNILISRSL